MLSIDPGALANVLGATGPVKLSSGQLLTEKNAAQVLMNTVYLTILDPKKQDEFFAATAGSVFHAMMSGQGKPSATVDALAQSAREGRLMVWSAHKDEQALLSGTVLSGELVGVEGKSPVIGVYLNDGSAAKIDYYLRTDVVATPTGCRPGGAQTVNVKVTLTSTAPANAASLPPYLASGNVIPNGEVRTNVLPAQSGGAMTFGSAAASRVSSPRPTTASRSSARPFSSSPASRSSSTNDILTGQGQPDTPVLPVTPVTLGKNRHKRLFWLLRAQDSPGTVFRVVEQRRAHLLCPAQCASEPLSDSQLTQRRVSALGASDRIASLSASASGACTLGWPDPDRLLDADDEHVTQHRGRQVGGQLIDPSPRPTGPESLTQAVWRQRPCYLLLLTARAEESASTKRRKAGGVPVQVALRACMPSRGSIAAPLEPQSAGFEVADVKHQGSGAEGPGIRAPHDAPDQPGVTRLAQERQLGHRRPRTLRRIVFTLILLLAVVAGSVVWVGLDAVKARDELKAAATQVHLLQDQVEKGDRKAVAVTIKSVQVHAAAAQAKTHGPQWSVVGALPWVGPNVKAVQTISEVVNGLAVKALPSLMDATALADPATLASSDGAVDLKPLVRAAAKVVAANAELQRAARRLDAIDPKPLFPGVAAPLADLRAQVTKFASTTATAARAARLLSSSLGG